MSLDSLYSILKKAEFPIRSRDDLIRVIGGEIITFDGHQMNAEDIAVHISKYPVRNVAEFFKDFMEEEAVAYGMHEAEALGRFEAML